ncbi:MAG: glycoside hydrolase family 3 N-terminal domain-containing protein [Muribaculaceae bacterium]
MHKALYVMIACLMALPMQAKKTPIYKDPKQPIEKRVDDLLSRMTVEEKVMQLCCWYMAEGSEIYRSSPEHSMQDIEDNILKGYGSVSTPARNLYAEQSAEMINKMQQIAITKTRLGIPVLVGDEALHGIDVKGACCLPQPIGMAATWNIDLMHKVATAIGKEAHSTGVRQVMSPVLDLGREPRHGRFYETFGEDPLLVSLMGGAFVSEVQSQGVVCTPKHFVANFVGEAGREGANMEISERALRETHFVPYEYAVRQCGALGIMTAYNAVDGVPCAINKWLMQDILRDEWGFKGIVVSDWSSVPHLRNFHHCIDSLQQGAVLAVRAGMDIDLPHGESFIKLVQAVKQGQLSESGLNVNVGRVLWLKFHLGLFENPYVDAAQGKLLRDCAEHRQLARQMARESIVLLKNDGTLPIGNSVKRIAVLGPNAAEVRLGGYTANDVNPVSPLDGLRNILGDKVELVYQKGAGIFNSDSTEVERAIEAVKTCDMAILFMGGDGNNSGQGTGGETVDRIDLRLMGKQEEFISKVAETGKPVVVVLVDGRPVVMSQWFNKVNGVAMMWYAGEEGGNAIAEVLSGEFNPCGKLPCTFPISTGQCPLYYSCYPMGRASRSAEISVPYDNYRYNPQFPFGFGLSYTTFSYSDLTIEHDNSTSPVVTVEITNTGSVPGTEVAQLYLASKTSRVVRRVKELKSFKRVHLEPGETKTVKFTLAETDFMFLNEKLQKEVGEGSYEVTVGPDAMHGQKAQLTVKQ